MKRLADLTLKILLFFLVGFLSAVASFVFQVFSSGALLFNPLGALFFFVFLEEIFKFFFWKSAWALTFSFQQKNPLKMFFFTFIFALGFWLLEMIFLKLKTFSWPISLASLILLGIHWLTVLFLAGSNQKLEQKKYWLFILLFWLALLAHFAYNFLLAGNVF